MTVELREELVDLRREILAMGAAVEQRVNQAIDALADNDPELAMRVRTGDDEIDAMEMEIERECLRILALTQPFASDLRFVLAVMRINNELERVGDLAKSVSKRVLDLDKLAGVELPVAIAAMAKETRWMFSSAIQSLADADVELARRIRQADNRVDDLQKEIFAWAQVEIPRHVEVTASAIHIMSVARKFERIGDLSTNIAEDVIFISDGTLVRHDKV